ncbi:hypothetical protein PanWU01x14_299060 [Parasponia andersonii]|uniref:Uncharacterized protein n=1 Tax=Parasponia andersonii TaxID=3476 RepID=A0A2P5AUJ3_PARAD|nr:hypothetical protein PanWU01x14_299060 [Parasponia andersonii]
MAVQQQQNNVRFSVNVKPLPWQVKDMTNKQLPPVSLVNIHFQYYQRHGPSPVPAGGTISNVEIQDRNFTCQLDLWELIKVLEAYSSNIPSQKLSMLGVKQDRHKEIVEKIVEWARTAVAEIIKEGRGDPSTHHQDPVLPVHVKIVSHECVMQSLECTTIEYFHVRIMRLKRLLVKTAESEEKEAPVAVDNGRNEITPDAREGGDENTS